MGKMKLLKIKTYNKYKGDKSTVSIHLSGFHGFSQLLIENMLEKENSSKFQKSKTWIFQAGNCLHNIYIVFSIICISFAFY